MPDSFEVLTLKLNIYFCFKYVDSLMSLGRNMDGLNIINSTFLIPAFNRIPQQSKHNLHECLLFAQMRAQLQLVCHNFRKTTQLQTGICLLQISLILICKSLQECAAASALQV